MHATVDRRSFLQAAACAAVAAPFAQPLRAACRWLPGGSDRVLVVLELEGGNDGLNTVIPLDDARYPAARPRLSAVRAAARPLGGGYGLHGSLAALHERIRAGAGAVIHGVGNDRPDRSHF